MADSMASRVSQRAAFSFGLFLAARASSLSRIAGVR